MNVFRPTSMKARRSRTRLELQSLEAREVPATLLDLTTAVPRMLRRGAIPIEKLRGIIGYVATDD